MVLAAGGGTRFAGSSHKLLATLGDATVIASSVAAPVHAGLLTAVVWGAVDLAPHVPPGVVLLHNPEWASGQASSLQAGLRWAATQGCDEVVIGLGDEPSVGAETWHRVAGAEGGPIVIAAFGPVRTPPVRLARSVWPFLPTLGDVGAGSLLRDRPELVVAIECDGDPTDIDTVEDLAKWS